MILSVGLRLAMFVVLVLGALGTEMSLGQVRTLIPETVGGVSLWPNSFDFGPAGERLYGGSEFSFVGGSGRHTPVVLRVEPSGARSCVYPAVPAGFQGESVIGGGGLVLGLLWPQSLSGAGAPTRVVVWDGPGLQQVTDVQLPSVWTGANHIYSVRGTRTKEGEVLVSGRFQGPNGPGVTSFCFDASGGYLTATLGSCTAGPTSPEPQPLLLDDAGEIGFTGCGWLGPAGDSTSLWRRQGSGVWLPIRLRLPAGATVIPQAVSPNGRVFVGNVLGSSLMIVWSSDSGFEPAVVDFSGLADPGGSVFSLYAQVDVTDDGFVLGPAEIVPPGVVFGERKYVVWHPTMAAGPMLMEDFLASVGFAAPFSGIDTGSALRAGGVVRSVRTRSGTTSLVLRMDTGLPWPSPSSGFQLFEFPSLGPVIDEPDGVIQAGGGSTLTNLRVRVLGGLAPADTMRILVSGANPIGLSPVLGLAVGQPVMPRASGLVLGDPGSALVFMLPSASSGAYGSLSGIWEANIPPGLSGQSFTVQAAAYTGQGATVDVSAGLQLVLQ